MLHSIMNRRLRFLLISLLLGVYACSPAQQKDRPASIITKPVELTRTAGTFRLTKSTALILSSNEYHLAECAVYFAEYIKPATGFQLKAQSGTQPKPNSIFLHIVKDELLGVEGYGLTITQDHIEIRAIDRSGIFYGLQSLLQLLPAEISSELRLTDVVWDAPCVTVRDAPRFQWRGMHLDVCRHFFPVSFIKTYIDMIDYNIRTLVQAVAQRK